METRRWINHSLPQTLGIATILLYIDAFFLALYGGLVSVFGLALTAMYVASGFGIANTKRWGYNLAVVASFLPAVLRFLIGGFGAVFAQPISLVFEIALIALLLHEQSRQYVKIWFE